MSTPADRLRAARQKAGFESASAAAKAFGWTVSSYLGHENGSRGLQIDAAQRYARAFKVDWSYLLGGGKYVSSAAVGVPVIAQIGYNSTIKSREDAERLLVGVEGFNADEMIALSERQGRSVDYVMAYVNPGQALFLGDEIVVSRAEGAGRHFRTYILRDNDDHRGDLMLGRGGGENDPVWYDFREVMEGPEAQLEGVVVAVFQDRQRRKGIEAAGYSDRVD